MKAAVYYDINDFRVEEVPLPEIGPEEVLVKVKACGFCTTDIFKAKYKKVKPGTVLGHEISGEVSNVGEKVVNLKIGDRVAVLHHAPCNTCYFCLRGQEDLCEQYKKGGVIPGGFSEYIRVLPELAKKTVFKIPDHLSYVEASMTEPTACCVKALTKCNIRPSDTLLVIGDGPMGILLAVIGRYFSTSKVILSGHHEFRLEKARELGVDSVVNSKKENLELRVKEATEGRGADVVIMALASTHMAEEALKLAREGGKVCLFGDFRDVPEQPMQISPDFMISKDRTLFGSWGSAPRDYEIALRMISSGRVPVKQLITHTVPLNDFKVALDLLEKREESLRVVVLP
ncbi:MAG: alcohol dehydrogenase catalytic domain-containing protein [Nitrososphaeria archaeon]